MLRGGGVPFSFDRLGEHARSFLGYRLELDTVCAFEAEGEGALMRRIEG